jgi:hypothetical protein
MKKILRDGIAGIASEIIFSLFIIIIGFLIVMICWLVIR